MRTISTSLFYFILVPVRFSLASPADINPCSTVPSGGQVCVRKQFKFVSCLLIIFFEGAGKILFCGNPVQALRARREKLRVGVVYGMKRAKHLLNFREKNTLFMEKNRSLLIRYKCIHSSLSFLAHCNG